MSTDNANTEITLHADDLRLRVSSYGASLRGMWREGRDGKHDDIITGYTGAAGKVGGQGDVLIPFPGRVRDGRYSFDGQPYQMSHNDKEGPNAIHGFLRTVPWEIEEQSPNHVTFVTTLGADNHPGYPFSLEVTVTYALEQGGLTCRFVIRNTGHRTAPVAAGFHPYFTVGSTLIDADLLQAPMAATLEFEQLLPTGRVVPVDGTSYDYRLLRPVGDTAFNTCYIEPLRDPDGLLRFVLAAPDGARTVTVWLDGAFNYVVLFSGDALPETHRRRALAIEPITCGTDAFNHPEWGLAVLEPGETLAGAWGVTADFRDSDGAR